MGSQHDRLLTFREEWDKPTDHIIARTSGSTGAPKEICLPKADMTVSARATCTRFNITCASTLWLPLSIDYIAGKMMVVRSIVSGARLIVTEPSRTLQLPDTTHPIDLAAIVPAQIEGLLKALAEERVTANSSPSRPAIKNVIIGGAPLSASQELALRIAPFRAYATYGMTETCSHIALRDITAGQETFTTMPGIAVSVEPTDSSEALEGPNPVGHLVIEAPEYSFINLITNDIVELLSPTEFRWLGRGDNVIISGSLKVHPEAVERAIAPVMGSVPYAITSRPSPEWGEEVVLAVAGDVDPDLLHRLRPLLKPWEVPKTIVRIDAIPLTANAKIDRPKLKEAANKTR